MKKPINNRSNSLNSLNSLKFLKTLKTLSPLILLATSCVKEPLHETDHPEYGKINSLTTVWDDRATDIPVPNSYTAAIGDYSTTLQGTTNEIKNYFPAGNYPIHIYNVADNIAVSGTTATANYPAPAPSPVERAGGEVGWFFTGTENITVEKDKDHAVTVAMHQQVRQLTLVIAPTGGTTDRIIGIEATLSGIAGAINIETGQPSGDAVSVNPAFAKDGDGNYRATLRLLDVTGSAQTLILRLKFRDGSPGDLVVASDLTAQLQAFGSNKKTPLTLGAQLVETQTETGLSTVVSDWITEETNTGTAN